MMRYFFFICSLLCLLACSTSRDRSLFNDNADSNDISTSIVILGTIQDAGSPHIGCAQSCCEGLFINPDPKRLIISLGLYDATTQHKYIFDATPDLPRQMKFMSRYGRNNISEIPAGIFLTHAHIGHYAGLMYLGKEAMNATRAKVYAMPRMKRFLEDNGPWGQLVQNENIVIEQLYNEKEVILSKNISVIPITVPHRDEYSETVGFKIIGPTKTALFIPDIDKWTKWNKDIIEEIKAVDYAFLDATFFSGEEINNRDIKEIPHPFVIESLEKFSVLNKEHRSKVIFIHFNHTNPMVNIESKEAKQVLRAGFKIGQLHEVFEL